MSEIYDLPEEEFYTSLISDKVFDAAMNGMNVNREYSKTAVDYLIGHMPNPENLPDDERRVQYDGYLSQLKHWR